MAKKPKPQAELAAEKPEEDSAPPKKKEKKKKKKKPNKVPDKVLEYLTSWNKQDGSWKFNKKINVGLRTKMLNKALIPDEYFDILLRYLVNGEGKAKKDAFTIAEGVVQNAEGDSDFDKDKLKRAERLVEALK